jgi:hypothetical protein
MAIEAPLHRERSGLSHQRHALDFAVTGRATDALGDVDAVVEIDVIGQPVHLAPMDRIAGCEAPADRLEHRRVGPYLRMTVHAGFRRRYGGDRRSLHAIVAESTVDPEPADMMFMAEGNRLGHGDVLIRHVR